MKKLSNATALTLWWVIRAYQLTLSFWLGRTCRFHPTCSHYMQEAILTHGPAKGLLMGLNRLRRCGPGGGQGYDPVPPKEEKTGAS